jgi:glucose/mannose transport system substrate-binding protein
MRSRHLFPLALFAVLTPYGCSSSNNNNSNTMTDGGSGSSGGSSGGGTGSSSGGTGSSSGGGGDAAPENLVEIYTYWTSQGDSTALNAFTSGFSTMYPSISVQNDVPANTSSDQVSADFAAMNQRLAAGNPPDLWSAILGSNLINYVKFVPPGDGGTTTPTDASVATTNQCADLTSLYASEGWTSKIPPSVVAAMKLGDPSGIWALPVSVGRINELYYNKAIFTTYGLTPPATLADLFAIGDALKGKTVPTTSGNPYSGMPIIPMAVAAGEAPPQQTWPVRFLADAILMSETGGIALRQAYYTGTASQTDPIYVQAASDLNKLFTTYSNAGNATLIGAPAADGGLNPDDAQATTFQHAEDMLHYGRAAMFIHGNWVTGDLVAKGDQPGVDFGIVQFPAKAFVYAGDSFVMAKNPPHPQAALDFLKYVGSAAAQSAFNKLKGAIPARIDADTSTYDPLTKAEAADFTDPSVTPVPCNWDYPPTDYWLCWEAALLSLIQNKDPAAYVSACAAKYPELANP